jgi:hypothetical protein
LSKNIFFLFFWNQNLGQDVQNNVEDDTNPSNTEWSDTGDDSVVDDGSGYGSGYSDDDDDEHAKEKKEAASHYEALRIEKLIPVDPLDPKNNYYY